MFGLLGKIEATPGTRDELIAILDEGLRNLPGLIYHNLHRDSENENLIWVSEAWDQQSSHTDSLQRPDVQAAISKGKPLIANFSRIATTTPVDQRDLTVNYIELPAGDFEKTTSFYGAVFNWNFQEYGDNYLAFFDATIYGGFFKSDKRSQVENGAALVVFYAADLEAIYKRIQGEGGKIEKEIFSFPGGRRFHFLDPNGNELAVWSDK
jgi:hypothetical protein